MAPSTRRIVMVGFGEAAEAFVAGWGAAAEGGVAAYDVKAEDPDARAAILARAATRRVSCSADPEAALADAQIAFCLVTADQAPAAAAACAPHLPERLLWLDGNSCAPGTKRRSAEIIERAGGRYVDLAIMAPVHPRLHKTPGLVAGPHAEAAIAALDGLGMNLAPAGPRVGDASTIKMLRSVMIKGFEALSAECLLAARAAGVEASVLASLQASDPGWNWEQRGAYNLERMMVHGTRRAAEMQEVALTLRELGLPDRMTRAAAEWQARIGGLALAAGEPDLTTRLDAVLSERP